MKATANASSWTSAEEGTASSKATLTTREFEILAKKIGELAGLHMTGHKAAMMESRLQKRLRVLGLQGFREYIERLQTDPVEVGEFVNALTTNKTEFFREPYHFEYLSSVIVPKWVRESTAPVLNVWCAAASTGEEPYTLAMVLNEALASHAGRNFRILATDIDTKVLATAERGIYRGELVQPITFNLQQKYLQRGKGPQAGSFRITPELKSHIKFRPYNLIADELNAPIQFDVIFLRNVLIYFQPGTMQVVIEKLCQRLRPGGHLFIGHSETLNRIKHPLHALHSAIYQKPFR